MLTVLITMFTFMLLMFSSNLIAAKIVPYFYMSHTNKFTGEYTQVREDTKYVPDNYYVKNTTEKTYSGGWNYWITERTLHYTLNGK